LSVSKNGVASLAYARPSTSCLLSVGWDVDARDERGHDVQGHQNSQSVMAGLGRSKNGVASLAYARPSTSYLLSVG
jgi:hypothetical protein